MISGILIDTGPLVALLGRRDQYHAWAAGQSRQIQWPVSTCEAVLAKAFHLLRGMHPGGQAIMGMLEKGALRIPFRLEEQSSAVTALINRYADIPMSLTDACLVRMSELAGEGCGVVFMLDSDFQIYRRHRRRKIPLLIPPGR